MTFETRAHPRVPIQVAPKIDPNYINRELSWLDFNERVLALAEDGFTPLLERAKFLAIFAGNLDEFYQVRVAGLRRQVDAGIAKRPPGGMSAEGQLRAIADKVGRMADRHTRLFKDDIWPALFKEDVQIRRVEALVQVQSAGVRRRLKSVLDLALEDNFGTWVLGSDGRWSRLQPRDDERTRHLQAELMLQALQDA